jgi:hypothetical protein
MSYRRGKFALLDSFAFPFLALETDGPGSSSSSSGGQYTFSSFIIGIVNSEKLNFNAIRGTGLAFKLIRGHANR